MAHDPHHHGHHHPDPVEEHRAHAPSRVPCFALTISDTKTAATDASGALIRELLEAAGHPLTGAAIVPDEPARITAAVEGAIAQGARAVVASGGTGLTARDSTFEAIGALIERPLPGFGELFRMLSFAEIGSAAMLSRAVAGARGRAVVFALPGSPAGVRLALERLIIPELGHVIEQLDR